MSLAGRVLTVFVLVVWGGCVGKGCTSPERASRDLLLDRIAVAEKIWEGRLIEFGSPRALPFLREGWSYGEVAPDGTSFRWAVAETASFRLESDRAGTEVAFLECEPFLYEGGPAQWVLVVVNGTELAPLELRPGRERYPLSLPLALGENEFELRFRYAGEPSRTGGDKRRLAVRFYRLEVPFRDFRHRVGAFSWVEPEKGEPGVFLPSEGSLSLYLELPRPSRLRFAIGAEEPVSLRASPGASITVSIRAETGEVFRETYVVENGGREIFEREIGAIGPAPVEVSLTAGESSVLLRPEIFVALESLDEDAPDVVPEPAAPPDIVLLVLDGANALRMGLYGREDEATPVTDALGRESVVFDVAVTQAVYTIASIGSILTGQYPERHQSVSFADRLRDDVVTFPRVLSRAGYRTAAFPGNAVVSRTFGLDRGYDEFVPVWEREGYSGHGDSVVRAFRSWLDGISEEPFFAYVHFREPHFPYDPPPPFDTRFGPERPFPGGIREAKVLDELNREASEGGAVPADVLERVEGLYQGNLAYVDSLVGEVLAALEDRARPTVVILTADHGEALFEHGFLGHNTQLYEESVRVPLLIRAPGVAPRRVEGVVELIDLTPTILDLAGLADHPAKRAMQGRSLTPLLAGGQGNRSRIAFSRTVWAKPRYSARNARFKLIWNSDSGATELYDLGEDPEERDDRAGTDRVVEGFLKQELFRWFREQERLKSKEPSPEGAVISEDERRMLESLGYADHVSRKKRGETEP